MALTLRRLRRRNPAQLLFNQFKLNTKQKLIMFGRKLSAAQAAAPIASSVYFIPSQTAWYYPKKNFTLFYLGDTWDRLPVHIQNLLGHPVFGIHGQMAPFWWETARHDTRRFLIGFFVVLIAGIVGVSFKDRKRAGTLRMLLSVPAAFLAASVVAAPLIWVAATQMSGWGITTSNPWLNDWIGKGLPLLIIGALSGIPARLILARTFETLQLISLEKKQAEQDVEKWWWKIVYPETYRNHYDYLINSGHVPEPHGKLMGMLMAFSTPFWLFLLGFGIWNLYFGFAAAAGH